MTAPQPTHPRDLATILRQLDHGPSAAGLSYYRQWSDCGRKAELAAADAELFADAEPAANEDGPLSMLKVGLYFHQLMEARFRRLIEDADLVWDARAEAMDVNLREALRLYQGYHAEFGSVEQRWRCKVVGAEVSIELPAA